MVSTRRITAGWCHRAGAGSGAVGDDRLALGDLGVRLVAGDVADDDNALAEAPANGLYKAELVWPGDHGATLPEWSWPPAACVARGDAGRRHSALGHIPPYEDKPILAGTVCCALLRS